MLMPNDDKAVNNVDMAYIDYGGCDFGECDYGECEHGGCEYGECDYGKCDPNPNPYHNPYPYLPRYWSISVPL